MQTKNQERQKEVRRNEEKWSRPLMEAGWTAVPSVLLERQQGLGLDAMDVNILLHLARHWWHADNLPHPSKKAIAECMGVDVSTVRKRIQRLEQDGLIRRIPRFNKDKGGQQTNYYDFTGLIEAAKPFAEEKIEARKKQQQEGAERRTRKRPTVNKQRRPKLKLVPKS